LNSLPTALRGAVQAGWYEGSVFFAIMGKSIFHKPTSPYQLLTKLRIGIMNYKVTDPSFHNLMHTLLLTKRSKKWSMTGIYDIYDKSIATLLISLLIGAGASYFKSGDKPTATTLAVVAIIQGLGVRNGSYSRLA
jgi:hypothetical protein